MHNITVQHPQEDFTFGVEYRPTAILLVMEGACLEITWSSEVRYLTTEAREEAQHDWLLDWLKEHRPRVQDGKLYVSLALDPVTGAAVG